MCKAKSAGGVRCNGHRRAAAQNSIVALAAATSPLSHAEASRKIEDARTTGDTSPANRAEIDAFLTDAASRAETCEALGTRTKVAVVARLREAIGHLRIDRATLAAWRAALGREWAQVGRAGVSMLLSATVAAGVGGCGAGSDGHVPEPTTSATVAAAQVQPYAANSIPKPDIPQTVADYFGSEANARAAYRKATKAYMAAQMDSEMLSLDRADATPNSFKIRTALSATAKSKFDKRITKAADGDQQAYQDVSALTLFDALDANAASGTEFRRGVPSTTVQRRIEALRIADGSGGRPKVTFIYRGALRITEHDQRLLSPYAVKTTLWLTKGGEIDAWASDWKAVDPGEQTPDRW